MAAKVSYKQGLKSTYLNLPERSPTALYFCTDTRELFKGDDLYSDGVRIVDNYDSLPEFASAADGVLYFCSDTGCGYVLSVERDSWLQVIYGVDNETIDVSENGLLHVKSVPITSVSGLEEKLSEIEEKIVGSGSGSDLTNVGIATIDTAGLVKASDEIAVDSDGKMSIVAIAQNKILGLVERLEQIEKITVGGIRYCGGVEKFEDLPTDAKTGDLYEVYSDGSEWCWNGEKWFEYGKTVDFSSYVTKEEAKNVYIGVPYEISHKPTGTLVNYSSYEIRVMCPSDTKWTLQQSGENANKNMYYIGFKAYAPSNDVVSFKEDLAETISDETMYYFEDNDFAGVDQYGRKYSIVWLPVAVYDQESGVWTYYGDQSSFEKYIGWYYSVEWYNSDGIKVAANKIRINLANENCYSNTLPYYMTNTQAAIDAMEESYTWGDM